MQSCLCPNCSTPKTLPKFVCPCRYSAVQQSVTGLVFDSAPSYLYASPLHHSSMLTVRGGYKQWMWPILSAIVWILVGLIILMGLILDGWNPPRKVQYW